MGLSALIRLLRLISGRQLCTAARAIACAVILLGLSGVTVPQTAAGVTFEFDYRFDSDGFFDVPQRRTAMETAGRLLTRYTDSLSAVIPEGDNHWLTFFSPPGGGAPQILQDIPVPQNVLLVFPAGRDLPSRLAQSIDLAAVGQGEPDWIETVETRGQSGVREEPASDFGPLGGQISFNQNLDEVDWFFGEEIDGIGPSQQDFVTVAMHELMHLMGVGVSESFADQVVGGRFIGPRAVAVGSPTNPDLEVDEVAAHLRRGTESTWNGQQFEALSAPAIFPGRRTYPTRLDRAVLRDIGWQEATAGDATLDQRFDTADLLQVFQRGRYESGLIAGWLDGDWNDNGLFESGDLIEALQTGTYEQSNFLPAVRVVPEPTSCTGLVISLLLLGVGRRRRR